MAPDIGAYQYAAPAGPVITGVFTSGITTNSAFVSWATNTASTSYVQYGPTGYTNSTAPQSAMVTQHSIALSGLSASTLYHFRAASQDANGNLGLSSDFTFTTSAPAPPPVIPTTFSLSSSSPVATVTAGQSVSATITASLLTGNAASVTFSASGQPAGTIAFSGTSCTVTCSTALTITPSSATAGVYSVVVTASGAGTSASTVIALTVTPVVVSNIPDTTTGLMARWILNANKGTLAADSSGNGNNGTLHNARWGKNHRSDLYFSGSQSYVSVNESATLEMANQLTVSFWVYANSTTNVDPHIIDKIYDWDVKLNGANRYPQIEVAGGQYAMLNYSLKTGAWHHIAFTFSNGAVTGYVDGVVAPFQEYTFTPGTLAQYAYGLYLGTDPTLTASYAGGMADVRVYSRALSALDIASVYAGN